MSNLDFPDKKYKLIYADPPWRFVTYSEEGEQKSATQHYDCMNIEDIYSLPVNDIADENCILLMWAVDPMLPEALKTIKRWGFTYKTIGFTWAKENKKSLGFFMGLGYWTRSNPEMCLLATKGKPKRLDRGVRQLVVSPVREHSRKPEQMYSHIEKLAEGPYVELFARNKRPGWDSWGNQTEKFNG
jgi:N6-adenosine-specific RNA methylase IME4